MPNSLKLTLFGSPEVRNHGSLITNFRTSKAQALFYYLAVTGRPHTRSTLAGLLWGDQPEAAARASLSKCLSNLHDLFGDALLIERQSITFNQDHPYQLDTERFVKGVGTPPTPATIQLLQAAVVLYRGDFLEGFYVRDAPDFEQWLLGQRAYYREAVVQGIRTLAKYMDQEGDLPQAITHTRRLLALEPWQEDAHRQLMTLLARSGQRAAALAQFETCQRILGEELAVEPDGETLALVKAIRAGEFVDKETKREGDKDNGATKLSLSHPLPISPSLPIPPTPLIGRAREVDRLGNLMLGHSGRLLTLIGPPGVGKTRLAQALGLMLQTLYPDGACFVPLAAISDPALLAPTLLTKLQVHGGSPKAPQIRLIEYLRHKEMLLILDNFEQIIPAAALVADLLSECGGLRILVTSRERLHLRAEQRYKVPPLDLASAIELFVDRLQRVVDPDFVLSVEYQPTIATLCQHLDCLPLAIELSVAQLELLSLPQLLQRLQTHRLDQLDDGSSDLPVHHHTLRAAILRSYLLLNEAEQRCLRMAGIFVGGFDLLAVRGCLGAESTLQALLQKSLVQQMTVVDEQPRFVLLETIRLFALEKLQTCGEEDAMRQHHAEYYLDLAEAAASLLQDQQQVQWLQQLDTDLGNLRVAFQWFLLHQPIQAVALVGALKNFWVLRSHYQEGRQWLNQALAYEEAPAVLRARALLFAGDLANRQGESDVGLSWVEESIRLYRQLGDTQNLADALRVCGWVYDQLQQRQPRIDAFEESLLLFRQIGDNTKIAILRVSLVYAYGAQQMGYAQANQDLQESITLLRTGGNIDALLFALNMQGDVAIQLGDYSSAANIYDEMLVVAGKANLQRQVAWAWLRLSECNRRQNDASSAVSNAQAGLQLSQVLDDKDVLLGAWRTVGDAHLSNREYALAAHSYDQALTLCLKPDNRYQSLHCWIGCAIIALANEQPENSAQLLAAAQKAVEELPPFLALKDWAELTELVAHVRHGLGEELFATAWRVGQAWLFAEGVLAAQALCRQVSSEEYQNERTITITLSKKETWLYLTKSEVAKATRICKRKCEKLR